MPGLKRQSGIVDWYYESCPSGGQWYKCDDPKFPTFIGCCSTDPCCGKLCPDKDLYPMGFGPVTTPSPAYPNHSCPYGGKYYTCANTPTVFQGCCESDPCSNSGICPIGQPKAAGLGTFKLSDGATFTVSASAASSTTSTANVKSPSNIPDITTSSSSSQLSGINGLAIAGIIIGALALLSSIAAIAFSFARRRGRQQSKNESNPELTRPSTPSEIFVKIAPHPQSVAERLPSPSPLYVSGPNSRAGSPGSPRSTHSRRTSAFYSMLDQHDPDTDGPTPPLSPSTISPTPMSPTILSRSPISPLPTQQHHIPNFATVTERSTPNDEPAGPNAESTISHPTTQQPPKIPERSPLRNSGRFNQQSQSQSHSQP